MRGEGRLQPVQDIADQFAPHHTIHDRPHNRNCLKIPFSFISTSFDSGYLFLCFPKQWQSNSCNPQSSSAFVRVSLPSLSFVGSPLRCQEFDTLYQFYVSLNLLLSMAKTRRLPSRITCLPGGSQCLFEQVHYKHRETKKAEHKQEVVCFFCICGSCWFKLMNFGWRVVRAASATCSTVIKFLENRQLFEELKSSRRQE